MSLTYTVTGRWPFPIDMLRYDEASAATPEDAELIAKASAEFCENLDDIRRQYTIRLTTGRGAYFLGYQSAERWKSFKWRMSLGSGVFHKDAGDNEVEARRTAVGNMYLAAPAMLILLREIQPSLSGELADRVQEVIDLAETGRVPA